MNTTILKPYDFMQAPVAQFAVRGGIIFHLDTHGLTQFIGCYCPNNNEFSSTHYRYLVFADKPEFGGADAFTVVDGKLLLIPEEDSGNNEVLELDFDDRMYCRPYMKKHKGDLISPNVCYQASTRTIISLEKKRVYHDCTTTDIYHPIIGFTHNNRFFFFRSVGRLPYIWSFDLDNEDNAYRQKIKDSKDAQFLVNYRGRTMSLCFDDVVIVVLFETGRLFKYDLRKRTVVDVTKLFDWKPNYPAAIVGATQDENHVYLGVKGLKYPGMELDEWARYTICKVAMPMDRVSQEEASQCSAVDSKCPVCLDAFNIPKIFVNCGHSICKHCENRMRKYSPIIHCPVCRVPYKCRRPLPTNYALQEVLEARVTNGHSTSTGNSGESQVNCSDCGSAVKASQLFKCNQCSVNSTKSDRLCGNCVIKKHKAHMDSVEEVVFVDEWDKLFAMASSSRLLMKDDMDTMRDQMRTAIIEKLTDKLDLFTNKLKLKECNIKSEHDAIMRNHRMTKDELKKAKDELKARSQELIEVSREFSSWEEQLFRILCDEEPRLSTFEVFGH